MYLSDIINNTHLRLLTVFNQDLEVKGVTSDSREVKPGYVFVAIKGFRFDGHDFIEEAIKKGAIAIVANAKYPALERLKMIASSCENILFLSTDNGRQALAMLAAILCPLQPRYSVAVTGTNGKSSTVSFARQLWMQQGKLAASWGTLGLECPLKNFPQPSIDLTTPDSAQLHACLNNLVKMGITHLSIEASSHGLSQFRLDGLKLKAAAFTNLSHDHLDYHFSMENYFNAKKRLFSELLPENETAVLNADEPEFPVLLDICKRRNHHILTVGYEADDIKIMRYDPLTHYLKLQIFGEVYELKFPLVGHFQVKNALLALALVLSENRYRQDEMVLGLESLTPVKGRLQEVVHPRGIRVYIDYAHTPHALEQVLTDLRREAQGRIITVFGCGGNRDLEKRPIMGAIAAKLSDFSYITDDNPRNEEPSHIRRAIVKGFEPISDNFEEISDRREAIEKALANAKENDIVVIAGKGHEKGQIINNNVLPYDDVEVVKEVVEKQWAN